MPTRVNNSENATQLFEQQLAFTNTVAQGPYVAVT